MNRREVLRLLATGGVLQLAPSSLLAVARETRSLMQEHTPLRSLSAHQYATVKTMAEMIIPRTETPGAADVGVAEFIDLMLTEWYDEADQARFVTGVADVDSRSHARFGKDFGECSSSQQSDILLAFGKEMAEQEKKNTGPSRGRRSQNRSAENFYAMFRQLTLTAYYTSEAGATKELHFEMIPDSYQGCPAPPLKQTPEHR